MRMRLDPRTRALMGMSPDDGEDRDLARIVRLYEIVKRYERVVEHLLNVQTYIQPTELELPLPCDIERALGDVRRQTILAALAQCKGNKVRAAKLVGLTYKTFLNWADKYGHVRKMPRKKPIEAETEAEVLETV